MADNLVIVESPAKAKTIKKYLGKDFDVLASYGHVRDLVPKEGAVDPDDGYAMKYRVLEKNERHVEAIARTLQEVQGAVSGDRPGPRGRGDRLAPEGDPRRARRPRGQAGAPRGVLRDHAQRHPRRRRRAARAVARAGERAAGAPRARLPGRLQPLAAAVEEGAPGTVRRPRAEPRAAHDLRARGGDRSLQGAGILDHRGRGRAQRAELPAEAARVPRQQGRAVQLHQRGAGARGRAHHPGGRRRGGALRHAAGSRSIASSAAATPPRPSPPRPCSRRPPASSASTRGAPCVSRSSCTRARTSARAASDSLLTCAPTRCRSPPRR